MSGRKYKVEQNGYFLGHHSGNSPLVALGKAMKTYGEFYPINEAKEFIITRGSQVYIVDLCGEEN